MKVLDFGLAKLTEASGASGGGDDLVQSPTVMSPAAMTGVGMILGTAAYMSPEQARGRPSTSAPTCGRLAPSSTRCSPAKRAFAGDDVSDTLASVMKTTPDWSALPADVPPHVVTRSSAASRRIGPRASATSPSRGSCCLRTPPSAASPASPASRAARPPGRAQPPLR